MLTVSQALPVIADRVEPVAPQILPLTFSPQKHVLTKNIAAQAHSPEFDWALTVKSDKWGLGFSRRGFVAAEEILQTFAGILEALAGVLD